VLDSITGERADAAVVEAHRERHDQCPTRLEQARAQLILQPKQFGGLLELPDRGAVQRRVPLAGQLDLRRDRGGRGHR
jgi:hypothetical protein